MLRRRAGAYALVGTFLAARMIEQTAPNTDTLDGNLEQEGEKYAAFFDARIARNTGRPDQRLWRAGTGCAGRRRHGNTYRRSYRRGN
jgi:hypothetical protein